MVNIQVRVDKHLRDQAQQILSQMGMDMTTAVRLFLHQLTVDKGLPFRPTIDPFFNEANLRYLERAIAEAKAGKNIEQHQLFDV